MSSIHVAISATSRSLPAARVLAASIRDVRPDWPITALVLPAGDAITITDHEPFEVIHLDYLDDAPLVRALNATPYIRQARLAGPALVERLLDMGAPTVLHLAAETQLFGDPTELEDLIAEHDAVVFPRVTGALPDDLKRPDATDLQEAGDLDDGLFAVRNTENGRRVAHWWADQARVSGVAVSMLESYGAELPVGVAATPLLSAIRSFAGVAVIDNPGYGVSAWNLHERPLARLDDGTLTAGGEPLRIMRFPTFRADRPWWLADFTTRTTVLDDPVLEPLCANYAKDLRAAGWVDLSDDLHDRHSRHRLGNGLRYDRRLRRLHHRAVAAGEDFGDIFEPAGAEAFTAWLTEPAPLGVAHGINRYVHDAWLTRPDLVEAYGDLDDEAGAEGLIGWAWVHGREELGLQDPLLPARPDWVEKTRTDPPTVLVTGYLRGVVGLGEAARGYVAALEAGGIPIATHVLPVDPPEDRSSRAPKREELVPFEDRVLPGEVVPEIHLLCTNADQTPGALDEIRKDQLPDYTIGHWAWETDIIPERWERIFGLVDEIWVNSTWVAENIGQASPVPVVVVPTPVRPPDPAGARLPFETPDAFTFLFMFDFFSTIPRKNPLGLVQAFTRAFQPGEGPVLLLKTINGDLRPDARAALQQASAGRDDVIVVDAILSAEQQAALFSQCDCYVSLHRAEGFGITLAEAMALGKPVITTGWSGNVDFTTIHNSYLVDYALRAVGPDNPPYNPQGTWAEASVDHAAQLMREVWEHPDEARERGARAKADIERLLSIETVGARARHRLERIATFTRLGHDGGSLAEKSQWLAGDIEARLQYDRYGGAARGPRGVARRAVLRAMRPYTAPQYALDTELAQAVARLATEVEVLREGRARDQRRLRQLERRRGEG